MARTRFCIVTLACATALSTLAAPAHAETIQFFSSALSFVQTKSTDSSQADPYYQQVLNASGGTATSGRSLTTAEGTTSTRATASLASGTLKSFSEVTALQSQKDVYGFSRADIGDSFRTRAADNSPFVWNSSTASFTFDISGMVNRDAGTINDSGLVLYVLEPGAIDPYARFLQGEDTFDQWFSRVLFTFEYEFGPGTQTFPTTTQTLTSYPTSVTATFAPGGDFDWVMLLVTGVGSETGGRHILADFSNTVVASYTAPAGATTYSASGLFPGTSLDSAAVPEPTSLLLLGTGVTTLIARRRRRR